MNKIIYNYLIIGFLKTICNVLLVFVCLGLVLNLFEEIEFFKNLNSGISLAITLTLMFIPNLIIKLLPFIIFIAAMWYFISIKNNTDLLSLKVFGISNLKIITVLSLTGLIFGLVIIFGVNPLTSKMVKYYEETKANYSLDTDHLIAINKNGVWIKENQSNQLSIINAKSLKDNFLYGVTIYILDKENYEMIKRIESKKANIIDSKWVLQTVSISNFKDKKILPLINADNYYYNSKYNIGKINSLFKNLDTLSFYSLLTKKNELVKRGYNLELLNEKLHSFLALPLFLVLMIILASIFTLGSVTKSQNIYYIFVSIITCVIIYYFKDLSIALGQTQRISLITSVWIPPIAIMLFCSIGILQINEK